MTGFAHPFLIAPTTAIYNCSFSQVKSCGTDFRWNMFGITSKDADNLGAGLKICKKLRVLKIYNSKMDDDKFYSVYDGIKNLTGLEIINFQNNLMTDERFKE